MIYEGRVEGSAQWGWHAGDEKAYCSTSGLGEVSWDTGMGRVEGAFFSVISWEPKIPPPACLASVCGQHEVLRVQVRYTQLLPGTNWPQRLTGCWCCGVQCHMQ